MEGCGFSELYFTPLFAQAAPLSIGTPRPLEALPGRTATFTQAGRSPIFSKPNPVDLAVA